MAENFDAAGDERFVLRAFRTGAHDADDPETEFVAALVGRGEDFGTVRVADDLNDALAVAKVDEDHAAVVATTMSPAEKSHGLTDEGFINQARVYGSHISSEKKTNSPVGTQLQRQCFVFCRAAIILAAVQKTVAKRDNKAEKLTFTHNK